MMRTRIVSILLLCATAASIVLASCGGSVDEIGTAGSPPAGTNTATVTGVAANGAPVNGLVTLKDSSVPARVRQVHTNRDGSYRFDVEGLTSPFIIKVEWLDNLSNKRLYSIARQASRANTNPFSDAAVAGSTDDGDPDGLFERGHSAEIEATAARIRAVIDGLKTVLAPLLELYQTSRDPLDDDFEADHTGLDALFDDVRIYVDAGKVFVVNKQTKLAIFEAPVTNIASGTFHPENMPGTPGAIDGAALYASNCSGCHGSLAASDKKGATAALIQSAIQNNTGGMGSLSNFTALQIQAIASVLATGTPPPAACTYTYSAWGACQSDNTRTRSMLTSSPSGCTGTPVLSEPCIYVPPVTTCSSFTYSAWGACQSNNTQTRTVLTSSPAGCTGGTPVISQACTYVPPVTTCSSFTYSAWGACQSNNTQTRTVLTSSPAGCTGGAPVVSQACTYVPPTPACGSCHAIPPATGQHSLHTSFASCSTCHGTGYSATTVNTATHANGVKNIVSTLNWNSATLTCGTPGCHGSRSW